MSENKLVPASPKNLMPVLPKSHKPEQVVAVRYMMDNDQPSFRFDFDDSVSFHMHNANNETDESESSKEAFENCVGENERVYYHFASLCGLVSGLFSAFSISNDKLEKFQDLSNKDLRKWIVAVAKLSGYKRTDYKGAIEYLIQKAYAFTEAADTADKEKAFNQFPELAFNPSFAGLVFSVITQFCGESFFVNSKNEVKSKRVPDYYAIGETTVQKIVFGIIYWLYYMAVNTAKLQLNKLSLDPHVITILGLINDLPIVKSMPKDELEVERIFSSKLKEFYVKYFPEKRFENAENENEEELDSEFFKKNIKAQLFHVLLNEGLVRGTFFVVKTLELANEASVSDFDELQALPFNEAAPWNNRIVSKMMVISTAIFAAIDIAGGVVKCVKNKKYKGKDFVLSFIAEVNIVGIGRFFFAVAEDSKYWNVNFKVLLQRVLNKAESSGEGDQWRLAEDEVDEAFNVLTLDIVQARVLFSLQNFLILHDISCTGDQDEKEKKELWHGLWKNELLYGLRTSDGFLIDNEDELYIQLGKLFHHESSRRSFCLLALELALFKPYYALGVEQDKEWKGLALEGNYLENEFIRRQTVITQAEINHALKDYKKYTALISGKTKMATVGVGATVIAALTAGGIAFAFAPGIAIALAGDAVLGLHGAALTSASLALVGGGSLAAGGLGMAGGTAIITGGGALIGLAGTGGASAISFLCLTDEGYWTRQAAKLLTYCSFLMDDRINQKQAVRMIFLKLQTSNLDIKEVTKQLKDEENDLDKELIKKLKKYSACLDACEKELKKIVK